MQFLNDDNTEWIRKAAEEYPVQPFGMDWDAVAKKIHEEPKETKVRTNNLLRYGGLFVLFMLLSLVCNRYLRWGFQHKFTSSASSNLRPIENRNGSGLSETEITEIDKHYGKSRSIVGQSNDNRLQHDNNLNSSAISTLDPYLPNRYNDPYLSNRYNKDNVPFAPNKSATGNSTAITTTLPDFHRTLNPRGLTLSVAPNAAGGIKQENLLTSSQSKAKSEPKDKGKTFQNRFYVGFVFGPDVSTVKLQRTSGVGYNLGLLLGYRITDKWHVESGVLLNRKEYYTEGEYFKTDYPLPAHTYLTEVDGYCTMFEIPLNVRYNFIQKKQSRWFATAGVSSYLMNKEDYNYTYERYNVEYKANKVYKNASNDWLTAANASVGLEQSLNKRLQFRIEPYFKVPLKGMGSGKLPISSVGMNVGVIYPIK